MWESLLAAAKPLKREDKMVKARKAAIIGAVLVAAMTATVGGTAAQAQPLTSIGSVAAGATQQTVSSASSISGGIGAGAPIAPASPSVPTDADTRGIPVGPIVNWIKKNAPSILNSLKSALRSGWSSFVKWWNNLASWIRFGISTVAQMSLEQMFNALWNYFFG